MASIRRWTVLALVAGLLVACGGGDDDDDSGSEAGRYGTCDLRAEYGHCIEITSSPVNVSNQKDGCLEADGLWSTTPCPATSELLGCCEYTFGSEFRQCFYEGTTNDDPEAFCTESSAWDDGIWTPAGG